MLLALPGQAIQQAAAASRAAGNSPTKVGQDAHRALRDWINNNKGTGWHAERQIRGPADGQLYRTDLRTPRGRNIDLKPNTASGLRSGITTKNKYLNAGLRQTRIIYY